MISKREFGPLEMKSQNKRGAVKDAFLTGFTLVELLFVAIIIGALAALVIPRIVERTQAAKVDAAEAFIKVQIASALRFYEADNGKFPTSDEGLAALLERPDSAVNWRGPYLDRKPLDPWGKSYKYDCPGTYNYRTYDLYSLGPDGKQSEDDIKNW